MTVSIISVVELNGMEAKRDTASDTWPPLKVISHPKPSLLYLDFSGTTITVNANELLNAIRDSTGANLSSRKTAGQSLM